MNKIFVLQCLWSQLTSFIEWLLYWGIKGWDGDTDINVSERNRKNKKGYRSGNATRYRAHRVMPSVSLLLLNISTHPWPGAPSRHRPTYPPPSCRPPPTTASASSSSQFPDSRAYDLVMLHCFAVQHNAFLIHDLVELNPGQTIWQRRRARRGGVGIYIQRQMSLSLPPPPPRRARGRGDTTTTSASWWG